MRYAYFDCFSGISGDMILGAILHAGLSVDLLQKRLELLQLTGYSIKAEPVNRHGIQGTHCKVETEEQHHHRHLPDIERIITASGLSDSVKDKSLRIFRRLAEAEGRVHGIPTCDVHFHEIGALDAVIDVVGSVIGLEALEIDKVYSSPLTFGTGTVRAAHGEIPVPVPATVELARGYPVKQTAIPMELTTPTGAAIVTTLSEGTHPPPGLTVITIGYGAGTRETEQLPNYMRLMVFEESETVEYDRVVVLEANIDDMNPEIFPYFMERIMEAGALDVFLTQVIMKKGRPGTLITVLSPEEKLHQVQPLFFTESTTIGVRISRWERIKLPRERVEVKTPWGTAECKQIIQNGRKLVIPEFEECRRIASAHKLPLREVYKRIQNILGDYNE